MLNKEDSERFQKAKERGKKFRLIELPVCPACGEKDCEGRWSFERKEEEPS